MGFGDLDDALGVVDIWQINDVAGPVQLNLDVAMFQI